MSRKSHLGILLFVTLSTFTTAQEPATAGHVVSESPVVRPPDRAKPSSARRIISLEEETDIVLPATRDVNVGSPGLRESWLLDRVGRVNGIESAALVEGIVVRTAVAGTKASRRTDLEITGTEGAVADAARLVSEVLADNARRRFAVELRLTVEKVAVDDVKSWDARKPRVTALDAKAFDAELARHDGNENVVQIAAPRLIVLGGQRATIAIENQTSYIRDWALMVGPGSMIMDPLIDVVNDGVDADLTVMALPGKNSILVGGEVTVRVLKRPIDKLEGKVSGIGTSVTLELPLVASVDWQLDQLVLHEHEVGFLAEGMIYPEIPTTTKRDPTLSRNVREEAASTKLLRILVRVVPTEEDDDSSQERLVGRVLGFDPSTMQVFFTAQKGVSALPGQKLSIRRDESLSGDVPGLHRPKSIVGRAIVVEDKGGIVVAAVTDGQVARDDEVWFEYDDK